MNTIQSTLPPELQRELEQRLTRQHAAEYLGISANTLANWVHRKPGQVPFFKVGWRTFYLISDLDRLLEERRRS